ncbi:Crp/Fnr family transcriptional regulator [Neptunomonas japonica]|uniref:Crp/Fnr family transcriptional regulator n=1 Tax=Neptunomonas japonica TaxID=417574 RepID=UPI00040E1252|nr:Crp/Fnr family transcriptional regulator [Neptunomonas japonica]
MASELLNNQLLFTDDSPFSLLNESRRLQLSKDMKSSKLSSGEIIHQAGDTAEGIFCVLSGVVRFSSSDSEGRYTLVQDLLPGDWFGFMGYFGEGTRPQDANALESCHVAFMKGVYLDEILDEYPEIYRSILRQVALYSTDFFDRYFGAVNLSLRTRIAQMLLKVAQWQSTQALNITQTDLASLLGVTREAVGVHLNELQNIGAIELGYKKIKLKDPTLLSAHFS